MRRSEFFQRRKITKTIFIFIALLVITIVLLSTVGLKLLLNYSVFVADLFSKKTDTSLNKDTDVYGIITIDNIPTATNSATFIVSGTVINYDKVEFFINNDKVKEISSQSSDSFSEEIGDLKEGENKVYVKASTKDDKTSKKTETYIVIYKESKPKLEISEPADQLKTSQTEITIKGTTDTEVFVNLNDLPVTVDATGNFQINYRLKDGDNQITLTAIDIAGNIETKTITVTYQQE